jgi:hypothetical protein
MEHIQLRIFTYGSFNDAVSCIKLYIVIIEWREKHMYGSGRDLIEVLTLNFPEVI